MARRLEPRCSMLCWLRLCEWAQAASQPIADRDPLAVIMKLNVFKSILAMAALISLDVVAAQDRVSVDRRYARRPAVPGVHGLVTTGHPLASMAGMRVLQAGGNAVDASVAVLATLNVVRPQMSGAAGNGFLLFFEKSSGQVYSLGATGAAPRGLDAAKISADDLTYGIQAGATPGLFGGWVSALDRFGTISLRDALETAIDYAKNGHPLELTVARSIRERSQVFEEFPTSVKMFMPGGRLPEAGVRFRMPDLARTFEKTVAAEQEAVAQGASRSEALQAAFDRFYKGDIAKEMARFYRENGGTFTMEDFESYKPIWAEPVHATYRGYDVYSSPPTSRGGMEVLMQLKLVEGYDLEKLGHNSVDALHVIVEAIKLAKADVYRYVADPKFALMPLTDMISEGYIAKRRRLIGRMAMTYPDPGRLEGGLKAAVSRKVAAAKRPDFAERSRAGSTTSFAVADQFGNIVACTPTHGSAFGTNVVVGNTGLTFNNGTRVGSTAPYSDHVNYVRPGQIPLLNNSPVIVLRDGEFVLALGTPGGETIGQTQFQAVLNVLDFDMGVQEAVAAPRLALDADPNFYKSAAAIAVRVEGRIAEEVVAGLADRGHAVQVTRDYELGSMQAILVDRRTGMLAAGADPRRVAYAVGW